MAWLGPQQALYWVDTHGYKKGDTPQKLYPECWQLGTLSKSCILTYKKTSLFPVYEQHLWYLWSIWRSRYSSDLLSFITVSLEWHHLCSNTSITVIACFFKENIYDVWWTNSWWFSDPGTKVESFLRLQLSQGTALLHMKLVRAKVCR